MPESIQTRRWDKVGNNTRVGWGWMVGGWEEREGDTA